MKKQTPNKEYSICVMEEYCDNDFDDKTMNLNSNNCDYDNDKCNCGCDNIKNLEHIKDQIKELVNDALNIVKESNDTRLIEQAKSYWYANILCQLDKDHEYLGGSMCSIQDTIDSLYVFDE